MIMDAPIMKRNESLARSIEDLGDELLSEIFTRLPCHESVINCKLVSKRWLFILRNPKFVVEFLNYAKKGHLPWAFLCTMKMRSTSNEEEDEDEDDDKYEIPNHKVFNSPKFTLNFLPFPFKVANTFKDLILCSNTSPGISNLHYYYIICNPVTKQWLALPPTPTLSAPIDQRGSSSWACLTCEDPYYNVNIDRLDYRFRVVAIHPIPVGRHLVNHPSKVFNIMVFCSESFEWKTINVSVAIRPSAIKWCPGVLTAPFVGVLCNGMVCVRHHPYFGMFNPFDVTPRTLNESTLTSRMLRTYYDAQGRVYECGGTKLVVIADTCFSSKPGPPPLTFTIRSAELDLKDINSVPIFWHHNFRGLCTSASMPLPTFLRHIIGIHPTNKYLLYVFTTRDELVLCDMRSKSLKVLGTLHPDRIKSTARFQLQSWPTPLPLPPIQ